MTKLHRRRTQSRNRCALAQMKHVRAAERRAHSHAHTKTNCKIRAALLFLNLTSHTPKINLEMIVPKIVPLIRPSCVLKLLLPPYTPLWLNFVCYTLRKVPPDNFQAQHQSGALANGLTLLSLKRRLSSLKTHCISKKIDKTMQQQEICSRSCGCCCRNYYPARIP